jgi:hypothetical protein
MNGPALGTAEANTPLRCIYERRHRISISIGVGDDCMVVITYMLSYSGYLKAGIGILWIGKLMFLET